MSTIVTIQILNLPHLSSCALVQAKYAFAISHASFQTYRRYIVVSYMQEPFLRLLTLEPFTRLFFNVLIAHDIADLFVDAFHWRYQCCFGQSPFSSELLYLCVRHLV